MGNEIDRLEIAIETEAKNANRSLSTMERHLNKIADDLEKTVALTMGLDKIGNFDFGGLKSFKSEMDSIFKTQQKMNRAFRSSKGPRINRSDLKYTEKALDDIFEKFKKAGTNIDLSGVGFQELKKGAISSEKEVARLQARLEKKIAIEGTDRIVKSWESLIYDIQKARNEADAYHEALKKINNQNRDLSNLRIHRSNPSIADSSDIERPKTTMISADSLGYDENAMKEILGYTKEASKEVNTFEAQIKRLKKELSDLSLQGYTEHDPEYDSVYQELAEVANAQKEYKKYYDNLARLSGSTGNAVLTEGKAAGITADEMRKLAKKKSEASTQNKRLAKLAQGTSGDLNDEGNAAKKAGKSMSLFSRVMNSMKKITKSINQPKKVLDDFRKAISLTQKQSNKGMSWGRMIGSSVLFSFVFQGISAIQNAIKEGSDNLVQYSAEYNRSISSMVSSLLYLKNSWAAAFSPIVNVVAPYISAFIDMIAGALNAVGQFMAALTGKGFAVQAKKVWKDYGASIKETGTGSDKAADGIGNVGDAAKKATKDLKSYTLGIDELNVIEPDLGNVSSENGSPSGGSGGNGGGSGGYVEPLPEDMFETVEIDNSISKLADMFKKAIETGDFTSIGRMASDKLSEVMEGIDWNPVYQKANKFGSGFATFLNGLITPRLFRNIGKTIANAINTVLSASNTFAIKFDWKNLGTSLANGIDSFFENWDAGLSGETFSNFAIGILEAITSAIETLGDENTFSDIGQKLVDYLCGIDWSSLSWSLVEFFNALGDALVEFPEDFAKGVGNAILDKVFGEEFSDEIRKKASTVFAPLETVWNTLFSGLTPVANVANIISSVQKTIESGGENIKSFFESLWKSIQVILSPVGQFFSDTFVSARDAVYNAFRFIGSWFSEKWTSIKNVFRDVKDYFKSAFDAAYKAVTDTWNSLSSFFRGIANNAIQPIGKLVNGIIDGVNWVSDKLGAGKILKSWSVPKFARGSGGVSSDTIGMVNDQGGGTYKELIVPPHGKPFIPEGRNVVLPLQKGTKIMPAGQTKEVLNSMPHFAGGIGEFFGNAWGAIKKFTGNMLDYVSNPKELVKIALDKFVDFSNMFEPWTTIGVQIVNKLFDAITKKIKALLDKFSPKGVEKALKWAVDVAHDERHGYDQTSRWGNPDYDCSSLVISAFEQAGIKMKSSGATYTGNLYNVAKKVGFGDVTKSVNLSSAKGMKKGDILLSRGHHTAMYMGDGKIVHASINELGRATGGKPGDQTGREICTRSYYNYPWTDVLRYSKAYKNGIGKFTFPEIIGTIPFLSDGGVMSRGQIFMARENGPELVGRQGNKSVVMNNNQIVRSVSAGVGEAVDNAITRIEAKLLRLEEIEGAILDKDISVNIDGKRADKQFAKARRNTGYNFSPNPA